MVKAIVWRPGAARALVGVAVLLGWGCWAASASAYVYWSSGRGAVGRANLDGTGASRAYITGARRSAGVAVDGQYVYWADPLGSIGRSNLDGSSPPDQTFITGLRGPEGVAVNDRYIYWASLGTNSIGRANLDGTDVRQRFIAADHPYGVTVDGAYVYWADASGNSIGRARLDGGGTPDQTFITGAHRPHGVAVNGPYIYWANQNGTIGRANLDGTGTPDQTFITGARAPFGVAVAGPYIYWASPGTHTIQRANLDGTGTPDRRFIARLVVPCWVAVATSVPTWTLQFTAVPADAPIGTAVTVTASTNNILGGSPNYDINLSVNGRVFKRCRLDTCTVVAGSPPLGSATFAADVGPPHAKPFGKQAVVSATATVDRTRPTCVAHACM
jgi:virginiamycin B lyase